MGRPVPGHDAPEGYEWVAVPRSNWRIDEGRPCRRMLTHNTYCRKPSVAAINRGHGSYDSWWAYCPDHTYGKWVEDGQVMDWIVKRKEGMR